jgi:hypothetical protein
MAPKVKWLKPETKASDDLTNPFWVHGHLPARDSLFIWPYINTEETETLTPWIDALEAMDKCSNRAPLVNLLRSKWSLGSHAHKFLEDMLVVRYQRPQKTNMQGVKETIHMKPLVDALVHGGEDARLRLAELLEKHPLKRNAGEQATPAYARSRVDDVLDRASATAHMHAEESGMSKLQAVTKVSKEMPEVDQDFVEDFFAELWKVYDDPQRLTRKRKKKNES